MALSGSLHCSFGSWRRLWLLMYGWVDWSARRALEVVAASYGCLRISGRSCMPPRDEHLGALWRIRSSALVWCALLFFPSTETVIGLLTSFIHFSRLTSHAFHESSESAHPHPQQHHRHPLPSSPFLPRPRQPLLCPSPDRTHPFSDSPISSNSLQHPAY